MGISVKPHHPLQELLTKLLLGIGCAPAIEQQRMVSRACREAVRWHESQTEIMKRWIKDMEIDIRGEDGVCPECNRRLGSYTNPYHKGTHKRNCDLGAMLMVLGSEDVK